MSWRGAANGQPQSSIANATSNCRRRKGTFPQTYDEVLADDVMRARKKVKQTAVNLKRKRDVALGEIIHTRIKRNFLGPILTRRFMEADNSKLGSMLQ